MKKVALLFGSFNPIHIGHLVLANYMVAYAGVDEVWLVVSPHNPLKVREELADQKHRYRMVELALAPLTIPVKASKVEFDLPQPSYTIDTLGVLAQQFPDCEWVVAMGADNLANIERWKEYRSILERYRLLVYPRPGFDLGALSRQYRVDELQAPQMDISSTFIRQALAEGRNLDAFMPPGVGEYIRQQQVYGQQEHP